MLEDYLGPYQKLIAALLSGIITTLIAVGLSRRSVRRSLRHELAEIYSTLEQLARLAEDAQPRQWRGIFVPKCETESKVFDKLVDKLGILPDTELASVRRAYQSAASSLQMVWRLATAKDDPRYGELVPEAQFKLLVGYLRAPLQEIENAIRELSKGLGPLPEPRIRRFFVQPARRLAKRRRTRLNKPTQPAE
jgi:hypothetical protein